MTDILMTTLTPGVTPAEVLRAAVDRIDRDGWWAGADRDPDGVGQGRICMAMGLNLVASRHDEFDALTALASSLRLRHGALVMCDYSGMHIAVFNDFVAEDWEECRKEMLLAADAWERGELE